MNFDSSKPAFGELRVTQNELELAELSAQFPMLSRTEIADVIKRAGPMRAVVETELARVSSKKR